MKSFFIRSMGDLEEAVKAVGVLPYFRNGVAGWSVEENIDSALWFTDQDGPWEWKGTLAFEKKCVYGKLIRGKAAFVSPEWYGRMACWRRGGYEWETLLEEGLLPRDERLILEYVAVHPMTQSRYVRRDTGVGKGYDAALSRLEMQTYVTAADFQYSVSKLGMPYGWGNAVIELSDRWLGEDFVSQTRGDANEAFEAVVEKILSAMPGADEKALRRELK